MFIHHIDSVTVCAQYLGPTLRAKVGSNYSNNGVQNPMMGTALGPRIVMGFKYLVPTQMCKPKNIYGLEIAGTFNVNTSLAHVK